MKNPLIIVLVEEQLRKYILDIKNNIKDYNDPADNKVIDELYKYAIDYCNSYDLLMAKGNMALYKYNMGLHYDAENLLKEVVDTSVEKGYKELMIYYSVQLAFVQLGYSLKVSRNTLFRPEMILTEEENKEGEISKETLFSYHYFYGVVLRRSRKLKEARVSFKEAIEVATTDSKRARALYNVGITYYDEQKYNSAIDWSRRALDQANGDIETQGAILNNMANYYYVKGEIGKAYYYLELAMGSLRDVTHVGRKLVIYDTYLDLHSDNGTKLLQVLLEILKSYTSLNEYSDHLGTCLEKLFVQLRKNGDIDNIKELFNSLLLYTKIIGEKRSVKDLKAITVDIIHYLVDEGIMALSL